MSAMLRPLDALAEPGVVSSTPHKIAIIDVGSNSFRLVVITYMPGHSFHLTDEVRESVRLVHGLGATGQLAPEAMDHAVEVMRLYRAFCDAQHITEIVAVATSAVREAANRAAFLARVAREAGIAVRVLSGEEEAYYGYLAAVNSTTLSDGFVIDLGGGSLEITRVGDRRSLQGVSMTLGAVRMTEDWLSEAPASKEALTRLRAYLQARLRDHRWFRAAPGTRLIGQGGTLRNAARLIQKAKGYPLDELHGYTFSRAELRKAIRKLEPLTVAERRAVLGMKADRADIALAGAIVVEESMKFAGFDTLTVCSQGVREGLFYARFLRESDPPLFEDVRASSVMNIAHLYHADKAHADHVAFLAGRLLDQASMLTAGVVADQAERHLLWAASMLHDIGMSIDYNDHHRHSHYLILNSGLPGYEHRELALIALAALYHRKGTPSPGALAKAFGPGDDTRLRQITACLRLAEQLDRSRDGAVRDVVLNVGPDEHMTLRVISEMDVSVSVWSAGVHADVFRAAFGHPLTILPPEG